MAVVVFSFLALSHRRRRASDFTGADLRGVNFNHCLLAGANMSNCSLQGASLRDCDLRKSNLTRADLRQAALHGALLLEANLSNGERSTGVACWVRRALTLCPTNTANFQDAVLVSSRALQCVADRLLLVLWLARGWLVFVVPLDSTRPDQRQLHQRCARVPSFFCRPLPHALRRLCFGVAGLPAAGSRQPILCVSRRARLRRRRRR